MSASSGDSRDLESPGKFPNYSSTVAAAQRGRPIKVQASQTEIHTLVDKPYLFGQKIWPFCTSASKNLHEPHKSPRQRRVKLSAFSRTYTPSWLYFMIIIWIIHMWSRRPKIWMGDFTGEGTLRKNLGNGLPTQWRNYILP